MIKCRNCWAKIDPPEGWTMPDAEFAKDDSDDLSGQSHGHDETDDEVNSEEDCYVITDPPKLPTTNNSANTASSSSSSSTPD